MADDTGKPLNMVIDPREKKLIVTYVPATIAGQPAAINIDVQYDCPTKQGVWLMAIWMAEAIISQARTQLEAAIAQDIMARNQQSISQMDLLKHGPLQ